MIVYLDKNYDIVKTDEEAIYRDTYKGSNKFNRLVLAMPLELTNQFPTATFKRPDGRLFGPLTASIMPSDSNYKYYKWDLTNQLLAIKGTLASTITINLTNSDGKVIQKKNIASTFTEVYEAEITDGDVIIIGDTTIISLQEQINALNGNIDLLNQNKQDVAVVSLTDLDMAGINSRKEFYSYFFDRLAYPVRSYVYQFQGNKNFITYLNAQSVFAKFSPLKKGVLAITYLDASEIDAPMVIRLFDKDTDINYAMIMRTSYDYDNQRKDIVDTGWIDLNYLSEAGTISGELTDRLTQAETTINQHSTSIAQNSSSIANETTKRIEEDEAIRGEFAQGDADVLADVVKNYINKDKLGQPNGVATLDEHGIVNKNQLPQDVIDKMRTGYYFEGQFYEDASHSILMEGIEDILYVDVTPDESGNPKNTAYLWTLASGYVALREAFPIEANNGKEANVFLETLLVDKTNYAIPQMEMELSDKKYPDGVFFNSLAIKQGGKPVAKFNVQGGAGDIALVENDTLKFKQAVESEIIEANNGLATTEELKTLRIGKTNYYLMTAQKVEEIVNQILTAKGVIK